MRTATSIAALLVAAAAAANANPVIIASGQLELPGGARENRYFQIDPVTGAATPVSPIVSTLAGLAGDAGGVLYAWNSGLVRLDRATWTTTLLGAPGPSATGFEIIRSAGGSTGYFVTTTGGRQLHEVPIPAGGATPVGDPGRIAADLDAFYGVTPGTSQPFIVSLGAVGTALYGVNAEAGRSNLLRIDTATGGAQVVGAPNALGAQTAGRFSGFSALTGVDTNGDGAFDALYGNLNFDNQQTPTTRFGGIVRYDLTTGTYTLVGANEGIIFFGMASFPWCRPDLNADGELTFDDVQAFVGLFNANDARADFNNDGEWTFDDIQLFIAAFNRGC